MIFMNMTLIISAFFAGLLTFLAPCTLPLVPGYLGFISGVSISQLNNEELLNRVRRKIFLNGLLYVIGFSVVFIFLGLLFGFGGVSLIKYRLVLARFGGIVIIIFGLYMLLSVIIKNQNILDKFSFLNKTWQPFFGKHLQPGRPVSSLLFGMIFALGWTPCIGPVLGTVLLLASQLNTIVSGGILLAIFSLGHAIPFLLVAAGLGGGFYVLRNKQMFFKIISIIGGVFLIIIGLLLLTNGFGAWIAFFYKIFNFMNYERLLNYL